MMATILNVLVNRTGLEKENVFYENELLGIYEM
jgi:hypothetical protein